MSSALSVPPVEVLKSPVETGVYGDGGNRTRARFLPSLRGLLLGLIASCAAAAHPASASADCHTHDCKARVARKHKRAVVRPYVVWLHRTARCESGGNLRAVSPDGRYRGLYQFDLSTYHSVGGHGDPIDHGWLEQSYRAVLLRIRRGTSPWPVCGRHA